MAKKEQFRYSGFIKSETGIEIIRNIDMCNLPYDLFGPEFPLEIIGSVDMGPNNKRPPLPDMTGVKIYGSFDCSNYKINEDTVLPQGIVQLVCLFSIRDLGALIGKIPSSVQQIVVQKPLLNAIKRAATKKATLEERQKLDDARAFVQAYPHIIVTDKDGKLRLSNILSDIDAAANTPVVAPTKQAKAPKPELPIKTDNYLDTTDLEGKCMKALEKEGLQAPQAAIKRYIKQAFKFVPTHEMIRKSDRATVKCVHEDDTDNVVKKVKDLVKANIDRQTESKPGKSTSKKTQDKPAAQPQSGGTKIIPQKIKKYISKSAWKQIKKATGTSKNILLQILQDVQDINIVPTETGAVHYIKDGEETISSNVEFRGKCLSQRFDKTNNRPRIVWGIDGNVFVCQHYFADHGDNDRIEYAETLNKINLDISKLDLKGGFLLVSNLIKNLTKTTENGTSLTAESEASVEPKTTDQAEPKVTDAIEPEATGQLLEAETAATTVSEPVVETSAQTDTRKEYIAPTITVKDATKPGTPDDGDDSKPVAGTTSPDVPQQSEQPTTEQRAPRPRITRDSQRMYTTRKAKVTRFKPNFDTTPIAEMPEPEWVDIAKVYHEYITLYTEYSERQKIVSGKMATATDYELRELIEEMRTILTTKRDIENALKTIRKSNSILQAQERKLLLLNSK